MWWKTLVEILVAILLVYAVLLFMLWLYARKHPETITMKDALRLLPNLVQLIKRLSADGTVPTGVRVRLGLLLVYLIVPIDLVPDFIPVVGYADDVIVIALVLRSVIKHAGPGPLEKHWPGSPEGLTIIMKLAGLGSRS